MFKELTKYIKDKKTIAAGLGYTIGNYFIRGLSFITIPIFSRLLSTSDYGIYNTYISYESIFCIFIGLALYMSIKNAKYKYEGNLDQYVSTSISVVCANLGIWLLLGNIFYSVYSSVIGFSRFLVNLMFIQSFCTAIITFYNCYIGLEYRYKSFLKLALTNALGNIVLSLVLILSFYKEQRYFGRILGTVIPVIVIAIYLLVYFYKKAKPSFKQGYISFGLKYSIPIIPHGIGQVILNQFDRIMINSMIGASQAGIYSFAYNIYTIINVTAMSLDNVWGPWFYEKMKIQDYKAIRSRSTLYAIGMMVFSVLVMLVSPELILILGSAKYTNSVYCVIPIVIAGYFAFLYTLPAQVEYYYEKTKYIAIGTCSAAIVNVILNYIFIPKFGYVAAAYNTLVTYMLYFGLHYFIAWKIEGKFIFSNLAMGICSISTLITGALSLLLINYPIIRFCIVVIFIFSCAIYLKDNSSVIKQLMKGK